MEDIWLKRIYVLVLWGKLGMKWEMVPHYVTQASWDVSRKSWANSFLSLHGQGFRILFYYFPLLFHKCSIFTTSKMDRQLSQQKVRQRISVFPENWHFHSHFVLKTTKTPVFVFVTEILWGNFLFNNWHSFFDFVKLLCYSASRGGWIHLYNLFCPSPFRLLIL